MWLRPSIVGRPPPAAEHVSGAWMGSSVFTVGGCGRTGCHSAVHALDTTVQHGRHAWQQLQLVGGAAAPAPAPRGGHCVVASAALGGLLLRANPNPNPNPDPNPIPDPNPDPNQVVCSFTAAATASGATRTRGYSSWLEMYMLRTITP